MYLRKELFSDSGIGKEFEPQLPPVMLGLDLIVDPNGKVWIVEVNGFGSGFNGAGQAYTSFKDQYQKLFEANGNAPVQLLNPDSEAGHDQTIQETFDHLVGEKYHTNIQGRPREPINNSLKLALWHARRYMRLISNPRMSKMSRILSRLEQDIFSDKYNQLELFPPEMKIPTEPFNFKTNDQISEEIFENFQDISTTNKVIAKPRWGSQGRGVVVSDNWKDIKPFLKSRRPYLIQPYIESRGYGSENVPGVIRYGLMLSLAPGGSNTKPPPIHFMGYVKLGNSMTKDVINLSRGAEPAPIPEELLPGLVEQMDNLGYYMGNQLEQEGFFRDD